MSFVKRLPRKVRTAAFTVILLLVAILMLRVLDKHKLDDHNAGQTEQRTSSSGSTP